MGIKIIDFNSPLTAPTGLAVSMYIPSSTSDTNTDTYFHTNMLLLLLSLI